MTELEIERLVCRLVGDGSSYQKMVTEAETSNKRLRESLDQNTKAHKEALEVQKQASQGWFDYGKSVYDSIPIIGAAHKKFEENIKVVYAFRDALASVAWDKFKQKAEDFTFGQVGLSSKAIGAAFSSDTYSSALEAGLDAYEHTTSTRSKAIVESQRREREGVGMERARRERDYQRSVEGSERGRLHAGESGGVDIDARIAATQNALREAQANQMRLMARSTSTGMVGGERADLEKTEGDWWGAAKGKFWEKLGYENEHIQTLERQKKALSDVTEREKEEGNVVRDLNRELQNHIRERQKIIDEMIYQSSESQRTSHMNPEEKRRDQLQKTGMRSEQVSQILESEREVRDTLISEQKEASKLKSIQEEINRTITARYTAGMSGEGKRKEQLQNLGMDPQQVDTQLRFEAETRIIEAQQRQSESTGDLVNHLIKQREALNENRTALDDYADAMRNADEAGRAMIKDLVEDIEAEKDQKRHQKEREDFDKRREDDLNRQTMSNDAKKRAVHNAVKTPAEKKKDELDEIERLKQLGLSATDAARAIKEINERYREKSNYSGGIGGAAEYGGAEAAAHRDEFMAGLERAIPEETEDQKKARLAQPPPLSRVATKRRNARITNWKRQFARERENEQAGRRADENAQPPPGKDLASLLEKIATNTEKMADRKDSGIKITAAGIK